MAIFFQVGNLRHKAETQKTLQSYYDKATVVGNKIALKVLRTEQGIKDTVQEFFLDKLFTSYSSKKGLAQKKQALDDAVRRLPEDITSPVWRINGRWLCWLTCFSYYLNISQGLDPHQDTPVEVLHVVLLGFVKYFWRDLIQNQIKGQDDHKTLLAQRLSSLDVSGLGISPLAGETLVNYAGSLTGRDFRNISQAAPFVIYDMVPDDVFEAWLALSKIVPLIWQPEIKNVKEYTVSFFCPTFDLFKY